MKKKQLFPLVFAFSILLFVLQCSAAYATKPTAASFQETFTGPITPTAPDKLAGVNVIQEQQRTGDWTGDIEGSFTAQYRAVLHKASTGPYKLITVQADYEIDATVEGKTGTLYVHLNYKVIAEEVPPPTVKGNWVITGGTEELASLHGQGTFTWVVNAPNPVIRQFDGQLHFDP